MARTSRAGLKSKFITEDAFPLEGRHLSTMKTLNAVTRGNSTGNEYGEGRRQ
jgi:hypothetical protein